MPLELKEVLGFEHKVKPRPEVDPNLPLNENFIGVEVECEGANSIRPDTTYWRTVPDNSLRDGGREFIFREPLYNSQIKQALDHLKEAFTQHPPSISDRCSVHVHLNVSDMDAPTLHRLLMSYLIFERILVRYHKNRENNIFAIPFYKAPYAVRYIDSLFSGDGHSIQSMISQMNKYQALNLGSLGTLGTLEFRHMGGTEDTDAIYEWVRIILHLKRYALENDFDPRTMMEGLSGAGPHAFMESVFQDLAGVLSYDDMGRDIYKGVRMAQLSVIQHGLEDVSASILRRNFRAPVNKRLAEATVGESEEQVQETETLDYMLNAQAAMNAAPIPPHLFTDHVITDEVQEQRAPTAEEMEAVRREYRERADNWLRNYTNATAIEERE